MSDVQRPYTQKYFCIEDYFPPIEGITFGERWNGWECPMFTKADVRLILKYFGEDFDAMSYPDSDGTYYRIDKDTDKVYEIYIEGGQFIAEESKEIEPINIDGVEYFSIGGWNWVWGDAGIEIGSATAELIESIHAQIDNRENLFVQLNERDEDGRGNDIWTIDVCVDIENVGEAIVGSVIFYDEDEAENALSVVDSYNVKVRS